MHVSTFDAEQSQRPSPLRKSARTALFLDFDGTLVDLADTPDGICVAEDLSRDLATLSTRLDDRLAIVSGRALIDLDAHLGECPVAMSGSHGGELRCADRSALDAYTRPVPAPVRAALRRFADGQPGLLYEDKTIGAALHYRGAPGRQADMLAFAEGLATTHDLTVSRGKMVVELMPAGFDKGTAVTAFMARPPFAGAIPIFVGDDVTDEDGFRAAARLGGFGVLVGAPRETAARYRLDGPGAVHDWLFG
ncbi:MAG: trehalose-phosphatase [Pseudomonadota bacterium]